MIRFHEKMTATPSKPLLAAALAAALCILSAPASADFSYSNTISLNFPAFHPLKSLQNLTLR